MTPLSDFQGTRILIHVAWRQNDFRPLFNRFPTASFAISRSLSEFAEAVVDAEILVIWSSEYSPEIARLCKQSASKLKWIQFCTSGIDTALKNGGFPSGTIVTNSAGLRAANLAEHAFALLLFMARGMRQFETARRHRQWLQPPAQQPRSLHGSCLVIVGMGAMGQAVARRARAFGMYVLAISREYTPDELVHEVLSREQYLSAFSRADAIIVCLPSNAETRGFIDHRSFKSMKPNVLIVNISRGDIIDENDLATACAERTIGGAALDVATVEPLAGQSPLWTLDNVVITPHVAGLGNDETAQLIDMFADNLSRYLSSAQLLRRVIY